MNPERDTRSNDKAKNPSPTPAPDAQVSQGRDGRRELRNLPFAEQERRLSPLSMAAPGERGGDRGMQSGVREAAQQGASQSAAAGVEAMTITPAMVGVPIGSSLDAIQAARAEVGQQSPPNLSSEFDKMRALAGGAADRVTKYLLGLGEKGAARFGTASHREAAIVDGSADTKAYRQLEADASVAGSTWQCAVGVGAVAEQSWTATMKALAAQGLADPASARPLATEAVQAESAGLGADLAKSQETVAAPSVDDGGVGTAMKNVQAAAYDLSSATLQQRALLESGQADDAEAELASREGPDGIEVLGSILTMIGDISAAVEAPTPSTIATAATDVAGFLGGLVDDGRTQVLQTQIQVCRAAAKSSMELAGWAALEAGMTRLAAARTNAAEQMQRLEKESDAQTSDLANKGKAIDSRERGAKRLGENVESRAAMGRHLGEVLQAQRLTTAARASFAVTIDPISSAAKHVDDAVAQHRGSEVLAGIQAEVAPAGAFFGRLGSLQRAVDGMYQQRLATLAPAVGQIVRDLGRCSERGAR